MAGQGKISLAIRIKDKGGNYVFHKPVLAANGRLKPQYALTGDKPSHHPEGVYHVRFTRENGKRAYDKVGTDATEAQNELHRRRLKQESTEAGLKVVDPKDNAVRLDEASAAYMARVAISRSAKTQSEFKLVVPQFATVSQRKFLHEITGEDLMRYAAWIRSKGLSARTAANRVARVSCFLKHHGITGLLESHEKPKYVEREPEAYTEPDLKALYAACSKEEELIFRFFLYSGGREQEVANVTYRDLNFYNKTVIFREKQETAHTPKDLEERIVPLPDSLLEDLALRRRTRKDDLLVFPNTVGTVEGHFLRLLKRITFKAGLNCGECINRIGESCREHPVCSKWVLHAFRRTFATMHHEGGVPVRRIQKWLGHSSLETTLRYLDAAEHRASQTREWVNKSFAAV